MRTRKAANNWIDDYRTHSRENTEYGHVVLSSSGPARCLVNRVMTVFAIRSLLQTLEPVAQESVYVLFESIALK